MCITIYLDIVKTSEMTDRINHVMMITIYLYMEKTSDMTARINHVINKRRVKFMRCVLPWRVLQSL